MVHLRRLASHVRLDITVQMALLSWLPVHLVMLTQAHMAGKQQTVFRVQEGTGAIRVPVPWSLALLVSIVTTTIMVQPRLLYHSGAPDTHMPPLLPTRMSRLVSPAQLVTTAVRQA
jgi:hypothetical protein